MTTIKKKDIARFQELAKGLDELIKGIQEYCPEANLYLSMNDLCLMKGPAHDFQGNPQLENTVSDYLFTAMDGGDW